MLLNPFSIRSNRRKKICTNGRQEAWMEEEERLDEDKNNESRMNSKINSICVHFQSRLSKEFMHFPFIHAKTHLSRGFGIYFSNKFISFYVCVCVCFTQFISTVGNFFFVLT